jgi:hypothetical protein
MEPNPHEEPHRPWCLCERCYPDRKPSEAPDPRAVRVATAGLELTADR